MREHLQEHQCVPFLKASTKQAPVYAVNETAFYPLHLTHTDITGPIDPPTPVKNKYVAVFLDDPTRMSAVSVLVERSLFIGALKAYKVLVENEQRS